MNIILNCITIDFLDEEGLSDDDEGLSGPSDDEFEPSAPGLDSSCCDEDTTTIIRPLMLLPLEERCDVPVEARLLDEKEEEKVLKFVQDKCCCQSNPLQPGPVYFLTPRKCAIFGVCCEGIPRQINYLIDEAVDVGKGANTVVSLLHPFFENHGLGESHVHLHADNCVGQNKNNIVIHVSYTE